MNAGRFRFLLVAVSLPCAVVQQPSAQSLRRDVRPLSIPRVWTVDDSGGAQFTSLQAAVDAAGAGDVMLVAEGQYTSTLTVQGKGLTILGDGAVPLLGRVIVRDLPAGEELALRSLSLGTNPGTAEDPMLWLEDNAGAVWVEDCTVNPYAWQPEGILAQDCASVVLVRTTVTDPQNPIVFSALQPALAASSSQIHAFESTFHGASAKTTSSTIGWQSGSPGARLQSSSFLYAAGCAFQGGKGATAICFDSNCMAAGASGGAGIQINAGTATVSLAGVFQGGAGGTGLSCPPPLFCSGGSSGPATTGTGQLDEEDLPLRSYELSTPARSGTSYQLDARCEPGEFVWSVFSSELAPAYVPSYFGTQVSPLPVTLVFEGVADGAGSLVKSVPIPPLAGFTTFERLYGQGLFFDAFSNAYLGSPSMLVVVN